MKRVLTWILVFALVCAVHSAFAEMTYNVGDIVELREFGYGASDGTGGRMQNSSGTYEIKK